MRELKKVADSLMENIETEYDCPSLNPELGKKVAVLDLAMWVEESYVSAPWMDSQGLHSNCGENETCLPLGIQPTNRTEGDSHVSKMVQQIQFEFFSKSMAPSQVILASSAQPWGQKRTTLTQELIRRLLNCRKELSCSIKKKHPNRFMQLLKNSGYDENHSRICNIWL